MSDIKRKAMAVSVEQIRERLPHRYPFLLVDRIVEQFPGGCVGVKNVTANEPFFQGHFPGASIMPGVLLAEAMAQTAAFIPEREGGAVNRLPSEKMFLSGVNVRFIAPVIPGDTVYIRAEAVKRFGPALKVRAEATVDGKTVAAGEINLVEVR
jgi:3-hydroxyacyl-[acyl-carrier-protein] dehydratase